MNLKSTPVSRCLDNRLLVLGFEVFDLLAIFMLLAVLNFLLSPIGGWITLLVWIIPALLAAALRFGKKGKPDNYLLHLARYYVTPGVYGAFPVSVTSETQFLYVRSKR